MNKQAGFSLVELMVGLTVTALLAIGGTRLAVQSSVAGRAVSDRTDAIRAIEATHALLRDDFAFAIEEPNTTTSDARFTTPLDALAIFTRGGWEVLPGEEKRVERQRVAYLFENGVFVRRIWIGADGTQAPAFADRILLENLRSVSLRYQLDEEWYTTWPPSQEHLPDLVEVIFDYGDGDQMIAKYVVGGGG